MFQIGILKVLYKKPETRMRNLLRPLGSLDLVPTLSVLTCQLHFPSFLLENSRDVFRHSFYLHVLLKRTKKRGKTFSFSLRFGFICSIASTAMLKQN